MIAADDSISCTLCNFGEVASNIRGDLFENISHSAPTKWIFDPMWDRRALLGWLGNQVKTTMPYSPRRGVSPRYCRKLLVLHDSRGHCTRGSPVALSGSWSERNTSTGHIHNRGYLWCFRSAEWLNCTKLGNSLSCSLSYLLEVMKDWLKDERLDKIQVTLFFFCCDTDELWIKLPGKRLKNSRRNSCRWKMIESHWRIPRVNAVES